MKQPTVFRATSGALALAALLATGAGRADPLVDPGQHYDTKALIVDTVRGLPKCLKYCLLGIEIRIRSTGLSVEVYFVPRVEHHMTALHAMTSDRFPQEAYREWAALVGQIQKQLLDQLARALPTTPPRVPDRREQRRRDPLRAVRRASKHQLQGSRIHGPSGRHPSRPGR